MKNALILCALLGVVGCDFPQEPALAEVSKDGNTNRITVTMANDNRYVHILIIRDHQTGSEYIALGGGQGWTMQRTK